MDKCKTKKFYDTEFQAERAAAICSHEWGVEITIYKCKNHYHLTNVDKSKRNKHPRPEQKDYCEHCGCGLRPGRWQVHQTKRQHLKNVKKAEKIMGSRATA